MPPRTRTQSVQKASWRGRGGPVSSSLLFYRRAVMTTLSLALLACFALLIWFNWPSNREPLAASLSLTDYARGAAPAVPFGLADQKAIEAVLALRFPDRARPLGTNADGDAQHLAGVFAFGDSLFQQADDEATLLVVVSGHGCSVTKPGAGGTDLDEALLLPVDFDPSDPQKAGLPVAELLKKVCAQKAKCKVLAIDCGPIEHDLRLGTAVNRFADVLERELAGVSLAKDQRLVVITSHRTWERSLAAPADQRSVFNYFFTAALGDEQHAADHADAVCPDGPQEGKSDGRISVAELARFVQRQVSQWVWQNTDFERTQRPLVLVKRGSDKPVRLELTLAENEMQDDARKVAAELEEILLCTVPASKGDAEKTEAAKEPAADDAGKKSAAVRMHPRWGSLAVNLLAQTPAPATAPTTPPMPATPMPAVPAAPAAAAPPPAPVEDTRPKWLQDQAGRLPALFALEAASWTPADFDCQFVREQTAALLDRQQRELAGLPPSRSAESGAGPALSAAVPSDSGTWNPPAGIDPAPWIAAVRARNGVLLQIGPLADAVERIEGPAAAALRGQLETLTLALEELLALTDRGALVESRQNTRSVLYQPVTPTQEQCDVTLLADACEALTTAHRQLFSDLRSALRGTSPVRGQLDWLNAWELGQAIPLSLLQAHSESGPTATSPLAGMQVAAPQWTAPKLSVARPSPSGQPAPAARIPRPGVSAESVEKQVQDRRRQWLRIQARIANLLDPAQPLSLAALSPGPAINARQLNLVAHDIQARYLAATATWSSFDASSAQAAGEHWQADRAGRLSLVVPARLETAPAPARRLVADPPQIRVGLEGPRLGTADGDIERASVLDQTQPTSVSWQIQRHDPAVLGAVMLTIDYSPKDLQVLDFRGKAVAPTQPGRPLLRLVDLLSADRTALSLQVIAQRQVDAAEAAEGDAGRKELTVTLRLEGQTIVGTAAFRLPDSRFLDVLVAGHKATLERDAPIVAETQPEGWQWRQARPDEIGASRGSSGDYRAEVSPFPRYQSQFGLKLVNRAAKSRKLAATWHAAPQGPEVLTNWRQWQDVIDNVDVPGIRVPTYELKAGESWMPPLFVPPAPPVAGAPPPPASTGPPLSVLNIENGLLLVLADESDPAWQQRIWIRPRPLHPGQYLDLAAQFRPANPPTAPRDAVVVSIDAKEAIRTQLPPGPMPVTWFELADPRIQPPPPAPRDFSLPDQKPITADLAPDAKLTGGNLLRAVLGVDGYPRAANFPAIARLGDSTRHVRQPYVQLQLFEEAPAAGPPGAPPMPPMLRLLERTSFTSRIPGLAYAVFADFDDRSGQSLRLVHNENVGSALARWREDRRFFVKCRKPPDPQGPQLVMDCEVGEWSGSLGSNIRWLEEGQNVLRAQIVQSTSGQEQPLPDDRSGDQFIIVLDTRQPRITSDMAAAFKYTIGLSKAQLRFTVADGDAAAPHNASGVAIGDVMWGTEVKDERLVQPRPVAALVEPGTLPPAVPGEQTFVCNLPADATKEPGSVTIYLQATDRAGNLSRPLKLCVIEVRKPRMLDKIPGGGKAAKGK